MRPIGFGVRRYPVREVQGNIWVYFGDDDPAGRTRHPEIGGVEDAAPRLVESVRFAAAIDHAVVGLMRPGARPPLCTVRGGGVHGKSIHAKAKAFAPSPWGFTMTRHRPSANSRGYRLIGGVPETEIVFRLPGVRIEQPRRLPRRVQPDRDHPGRRPDDRNQSLHLLDRTLALAC